MPTFGYGHDLFISNNCDSGSTSYNYINCSFDTLVHLDGSRSFRVAEIEVYDFE